MALGCTGFQQAGEQMRGQIFRMAKSVMGHASHARQI
jgi:hypothetical protein